jgi:hypothetical protein
MTWVLFVILLEADRYYVSPNGMYPTMEDCFEARDFFMATAPQPKINYEAICVQTDKLGDNA